LSYYPTITGSLETKRHELLETSLVTQFQIKLINCFGVLLYRIIFWWLNALISEYSCRLKRGTFNAPIKAFLKWGETKTID
jgi:hypothetical protein